MNSNNRSLIVRIVAVLGALAVVACVWFVTQNTGEEDQNSALNSEGERNIEGASFNDDGDGDGLKDWEESLWGTDKTKADSDGDGTSDNDEIDANRNPVVAGPDDALVQESIPVYARTDEENLSTSESFQKDFFERLVALSQEGDVSEAELEQMLFSLSEDYISNTNLVEAYSNADVSVSADVSNANAKNYLNSLGVLTFEYREAFSAEKLLAIQSIFSDSGVGSPADVENLVSSFAAAEEELSGMDIPQTLVEEHLNIMNGSATMRVALQDIIETYEDDPLNAIIALNSFRSGLTLFGAGIEGMKVYTRESGISFGENEAAQILLAI